MAPMPHPLAGKTGEGPPIAPPNWKWRAGNRLSDMYFYSPSGKQFRSRPELAGYLQTLNNPPDANLFCWRVTDEVLKNGYVPRDDEVVPKSAKRKAEIPDGGGNKRVKTSTGKRLGRPLISFEKAAVFTVQPTRVEPTALFSPGWVPNLPQRGTTISSPSVGHPYFNGRVPPKGKRVRVSIPRSFYSILAGRSSFKWLYDSDTLEKFLDEARRLQNKSAAQINEMRNALLERDLDTNNICKYPNSAIRVFVRLLRNEEAPASMGKTELANLCVNWNCKKRHYWCLLEAGRMNSPRKFTKLDDINRGSGHSPSKGSVSHSVGVGLKSEYSDTFTVSDKMLTSHANEFLNQLRRTRLLDARLPDGSGNVSGNGDARAGGGKVHGEDMSGSEKASLRRAERTTEDETERTSEPFSRNVVHRDSNWDGASQATQVMPQNDTQPVLLAGRAPDLCGESIVVITGFKSSASKGTGIVHHGDKAAQLKAGSFAMDNCSFTSASGLPSTSDSKCQLGETHLRASLLVSNALDGITKRNGNSELDPSSKDVDVVGGFPGMVKSEAIDLTSRADEHTRPQGPGSYSNELAPQLLQVAGKQEPLIPHSKDVSPTANDDRQFAPLVSGPLVAERDDGTTGEHFHNGSREENLPLTPEQAVPIRDNSACWCKLCGSDFSFCRGCMCSFCRKVLEPGEEPTVVKCACSHVCHVDCALAANAAGVVKELGLDGELSCPSCSQKVDLWPFIQQRFELILSLSEVDDVNVKRLEKLLLQALLLLKGTEKIKYKFVEGLVIESYELIRKFPILGLVQNLLRAVRDELQIANSGGPGPDAVTLEGGLGTQATPEEADWLKNENVAWESLENAKNERLLMEQVVDKVHKAYADALNKRIQARSASRAMVTREPELLKGNVNPPVPEELLISQQAKVDQELKKLWDMRKFETGDFTTISALHASASAWIDGLKLQRVVVEAAQAKLQHLKNLNRQSIEP